MAVGNLAGVGNTTGVVVLIGPGVRGRFTVAALRTPEPEALNLAGSPLLVEEAVVVVVVTSILAIVVVDTVVIWVVVRVEGVVMTGGAAVVTIMGAAAVTGTATNGTAIGGNKSSGCGSLIAKMLRTAS